TSLTCFPPPQNRGGRGGKNTTSRGGWEGGFCHLSHLGGKVVGSRQSDCASATVTPYFSISFRASSTARGTGNSPSAHRLLVRGSTPNSRAAPTCDMPRLSIASRYSVWVMQLLVP